MSRYLTIALEVLIILMIFFVPLAFAGTQYWAWTAMEAGVACGLAIWLVLAVANRRLSYVKTPLNIVIAVALAYVFFQLVPLPASLAGGLCKARVALQATGDPSAKVFVAPAGHVPLSINRSGTLQAWFRMLAYGGFFFLLVNFLDTKAKLGRVLGAAIFSGVMVAFLGLGTSAQSSPAVYRMWPTGDPNENPPSLNARADRQFSSGVGYTVPFMEEGSAHWFLSKTKGGVAFGSFPSQDQAAGFLLMLVPVVLGVLFACVGTRRTEWGSSGGLLFSYEGNLLLLSAAVGLMLMLGVFATKSRDGVVVMLVFVLAMLPVVGFTRSWLSGVVTTAVVGAVLAAPVLVIGWAPMTDWVKETANAYMNPANEEGPAIRESAKRIASDFPLTGTGAGTFGSIYPLYQTEGPEAYYAENDGLQLRVESGWIGVVILMAGLAIYLATTIIGLVRIRDKFMKRVMLGTLLGSVAVLIHGMTNYDLYVPATAFVFTVLSAATVVIAQDANSRRTEEDFVF